MNEGLSMNQTAKATGFPKSNLSFWKNNNKYVPQLPDGKYSVEQVEELRELKAIGKSPATETCKFANIPPPAQVEEAPATQETPPQIFAEGTEPATETPPVQVESTPDTDSVTKNSWEQTSTQDNDGVTADDSTATPEIVAVIQDTIATSHEEPKNSLTAPMPPITVDVSFEIITLDQRADRIRKLSVDIQRGIVEIGNELLAAKRDIGHGNWSKWLKTEFDWTQRTANNYMRVAERFGKMETSFQFKPTTLIQLLPLPEGTEQEFIAEQAAKGKPVEEMTKREVQSAVRDWNKNNVDDTAGEAEDNDLTQIYEQTTEQLIPETLSSDETNDIISDTKDNAPDEDTTADTDEDKTATSVEGICPQRAPEQASLPAQVDDKLQQLKEVAVAKLADISDWLERTNDFQAVEKLVVLIDNVRSD